MRDFVDLVLPRRCVGCGLGVGRSMCCASCRAELRTAEPRVVRPQPCPPGLPLTWAAGDYAGGLRSIIVGWKEQGRAHATPVLTALLARALWAAVEDDPQWAAVLVAPKGACLVPVPSRSRGTRHRGRSPVTELCAATFAPLPSMTLFEHALVFHTRVRDQAGLSAGQRALNLAESMRVPRRWQGQVRGMPIVLVDDIVTTGSTLTEAARALDAAGAGPVLALTVAATARLHPQGSQPRDG